LINKNSLGDTRATSLACELLETAHTLVSRGDMQHPFYGWACQRGTSA
jgi:hypothetical protein